MRRDARYDAAFGRPPDEPFERWYGKYLNIVTLDALASLRTALGVVAAQNHRPSDEMIGAVADRPGQVRKLKAALAEARDDAETEARIRAGKRF